MYISILVIGSLPGARQDVGEYASGVVLHSIAYALLGLLTFIGGAGSTSKRALWCILKVAAMGAMDECVQSYFPYRTAAVSDWMVDVAAGSVAAGVLWKVWPRLLADRLM
jgi:VanZ family protein